jgi:hypothetical protein
MFRWLSRWGGVVVVALITGCGRAPAVDLQPASGTVVFPNGTPLAEGTVVFEPVEAPGMKAQGPLQGDGSFTLMTGSDEGVVTGVSRVSVALTNPKDVRRLGLRAEFLDPDSSGLTAVVTPGSGQLDPIVLRAPARTR